MYSKYFLFGDHLLYCFSKIWIVKGVKALIALALQPYPLPNVTLVINTDILVLDSFPIVRLLLKLNSSREMALEIDFAPLSRLFSVDK